MFDNMIAKYNDLKTKRENGEGGFTLIELLVVVVIIGILIAIAIPLYLNYQKGANDKASQSDLRSAVSALQQCYSENGNAYPATASVVVTATDVTMTCGTGITEKATLSDGTVFSYDNTASVVVMKAYNPDGKRNTVGTAYTYNPANGGSIK